MQRSKGSISTRANPENDAINGNTLQEGYRAAFQGNDGIDTLKDKNGKNYQLKISKNVKQALNLPKLCNINARSIYNKLNEFHEFIKEEEVDLIFLTESWERQDLTLDKVIKLEDHKVFSNFNQRSGKGGRPALIVNHRKYEVQDLTNHIIQIPWGVEAVWCLLTPKNSTHDSKIRKIACCSFYSKPASKKKSL